MSSIVSFITVGRITRPHGIRGDVCAQYYADSFSYLDNGQAFIKTEKSAPKPFSVSSWRMQGNILILKLKGVNSRTEAEFLRNYDIVIDENLLVYDTPPEKNSHGAGNSNANNDDNAANSGSANTSTNSHDNADTYYDGNLNDDFDDDDAPFLHHIIGAKAILPSTTHTNKTTVNSEESGTGHSEHSRITMEEELGIIEEISFPAGQELWTIKNSKGQEILFPAVSEFIDHFDLDNNKVYINPPAGLIDIYLNDTQDPNREPREKKKRQNAHKNKSLCGEGKKKIKKLVQADIQPKEQTPQKSMPTKNEPIKNPKAKNPEGKSSLGKNIADSNAHGKNAPTKNKQTQKNVR